MDSMLESETDGSDAFVEVPVRVQIEPKMICYLRRICL